MAQTRTEVRNEIENKKVQINSKLEMLEDRFETVADKVKLRHYVDRRPFAVVGVAAGLGFLLGRRRAHSVHTRQAAPLTSYGETRDSHASEPSFAAQMAKRLLPTLGSAVLKHVMASREKHSASADRDYRGYERDYEVEDLRRSSAEDFSRDYAVEGEYAVEDHRRG